MFDPMQDFPAVRTVTVRGLWKNCLLVYTDHRSPKVRELELHAGMVVLVYVPCHSGTQSSP